MRLVTTRRSPPLHDVNGLLDFFPQVTIIPRHIMLAIRNDEELDKMFKGGIPGGGVLPHIHAIILPKKVVPVGNKF